MEEPAKSWKSGKKRAAKTVIGMRERRTQGKSVVEEDAVVGKAEAGTGCDGMAEAASGAGQTVVGGRKRESTERSEAAARRGGKARINLDLRRMRPGKDGAREA